MNNQEDSVELVANGGLRKDSKKILQKQASTTSRTPTRRMNSIGRQYTHEIVIGTDQDPFNKEELVHTLKGKELCFFVIFYAFAVAMIVLMFELLKPVLFNPNYPDNE